MEQTTTTPNATGKIVAALVVGLIIGFVLGALWQARRSVLGMPSEGIAVVDTVEKEGTTAAAASALPVVVNAVKEPVVPKVTATVPEMKAETLPLVFVENQSAGNAVEVTRVKTAMPVWVAVRELKAGVAGNILGVHKVQPGDTPVSVELLRPTVKGGSYLVALYNDIGDPAFNYREDTVVSGVQGAFVAE